MTELQTARLLLRPLCEGDADRMVELAGDFDIARMTSRIPYPYTRDDALQWIAEVATGGREIVFAVLLDGTLTGACGLAHSRKRPTAELGYWIGKPYWGQGFATEAAQAVIRFGFGALNLPAVTVSHMVDNPASAAVIAKLGFVRTGERKIASLARSGVPVDVICYSLTRARAEALSWYQNA